VAGLFGGFILPLYTFPLRSKVYSELAFTELVEVSKESVSKTPPSQPESILSRLDISLENQALV